MRLVCSPTIHALCNTILLGIHIKYGSIPALDRQNFSLVGTNTIRATASVQSTTPTTRKLPPQHHPLDMVSVLVVPEMTSVLILPEMASVLVLTEMTSVLVLDVMPPITVEISVSAERAETM